MFGSWSRSPAPVRAAGLALALAFVFVPRAGSRPVSAQISFYPPVVHVPAGGTSGWLQLVSASREPVDVRLSLHFAYPESDDSGRVSVPAAGIRPDDDPRSAMPHLRFGPERLRLLPGRAQRVRFVVPDPSLPEGEYWARLTIEPERGPRALDTPLDVGASRAMMDSRVRVVLPVFVRSGRVEPEVHLDSVVARTDAGRVHVRPWLRNEGTAAGLGRARVALLDRGGRVIAEQERHVAVYTGQSPRFTFDTVGLEDVARSVRVTFTDERDDLPDELRMPFGSLEAEASIREPAEADYYYALDRRGREVGVLRGRVDWVVDGRPVQAWFPLHEVAAALGVQVVSRPGEATVHGHLPIERPVSFRFDPHTGRGERDGVDLEIDPMHWRWADSTLHLAAPAFQQLTGIRLEERAHTLTLHVRGADRDVPRFAAQVSRRAGELGRLGLGRLGGLGARAGPASHDGVRRYAPMLPSAVHVQHATWLDAADELRGVLRVGASLAGGGLDLTAPWRRGRRAVEPAAGVRWRWVSALPGREAPGQLRVGWGLPAGLQATEPGVGVWLTNAPFRRPSEVGSRVQEGVTEPGAEVQLWVGGRLLDAVVADAGGAWRLDLPLIGGENRAELRFVRSDGIFRQPVFVVAAPDLLPAGRMEYAVSFDRVVEAGPCPTGLERRCRLRAAFDVRWAPARRLTLLAGIRSRWVGLGRAAPTDRSAGGIGTAVDGRVVWAPLDRVLGVGQFGPSGHHAEWSYQSPRHLVMRGFVARDRSGPRADPMHRWGVALRQRSTGLVGASVRFERRDGARRLDLLSARFDVRHGAYLARVGADLRRTIMPRFGMSMLDGHGVRAGSADPPDASSWASGERVQLLLAHLPHWAGLLQRTRWSLDLRTRDGFRDLQGLAMSVSRRLSGAGTVDAVLNWSPGRAARITFGVRRTWSGLQLGHTLTSTGQDGSSWRSSLAVSGTATITREGWAAGEQSHERPGSARVFAWLDADLDGRWGAGEPALADVALQIAGREVITTLDGVQVTGLPTQTPLPLRVDPQVPNWDADGRALAARSPETWFELAPYAHQRIAVGFAPAHRVEGRVLERSTRTALAGAVVELVRDHDGASRSAVADASGTFVFTLLPAGRYRMSVAESTLGVLGVVSAPVEVVLDNEPARPSNAAASAAGTTTMLEVWSPVSGVDTGPGAPS